jgi:hypothetical protein
MRLSMIELTAERLRNLLHYDPETGVFTRLVGNGRNVNIGDKAGSTHKGSGYRYIMVDRKNYSAHRLAWLYIHGAWPIGDIDHMNGLPDDNRLANLRDVTKAMNAQNERRPRKSNTSGFMGVRWRDDRHCWIAVLLIDGCKRKLGAFRTKEDAAAAYIEAKRKHHPGFLL